MVNILERPSLSDRRIGGRAAIYIRVSKEKQKDGASLDVQLEACQRYCETNGLEIVAEFKDVQTGLDIDRPQYQSALALAKASGFDQLVVWRYDRSGRDDAEYATMLRDFAKLEIRLASATGESPDPFYQKLAGLLAWDESRRISIRVTGSKVKRFENGYWNSKPPFGYLTEKQAEGGSILVPDPDIAAFATKLFDEYATAKYSLRELMRWLNPQLPVNKQKSPRGIRHVLSSRVYRGEVSYGQHIKSQFHGKPEGPQWRPGKHQALVSEDVFDRVQQLLRENKRSGGKGSEGVAGTSRGGPHAKYLFTGLVFCGVCGSRFVATAPGRNKWPNYRCGKKHNGSGCASKSVYEPRLREAVIQPIEEVMAQLNQTDLRQSIIDDLMRQQTTISAKAVIVRQSNEGQITKLATRLSNLEDSFMDRDISRDNYIAKRDEYTHKLDQLREQYEADEASQQAKVTAPDIDQLVAMAGSLDGQPPDVGEWREIVTGVVDKITIGTGKKARASIEVVWREDFKVLLDAIAKY